MAWREAREASSSRQAKDQQSEEWRDGQDAPSPTLTGTAEFAFV